MIPVNPRGGTILGETVYPDLKAFPTGRSRRHFPPGRRIPAIVDEAIAIGAKAVWMQLRIINFEAAEKARAAGLAVVMDKCVKMEHGRFGGSLHWAGMNTEIISAQRAER